MTAKTAKRLLGRTHRFLARFALCARASIYLRNQAMCIINYHLGDISNPQNDGELALIKALGEHCSSFIDVGANVGNWTALVLQYGNPHARGVLFEPSQSCFRALTKRFGERKGLEVVNAAVGAEVGNIEFAEEEECGLRSSVVAGAASKSAVTRFVPVTTLDVEMQRRGFETIDLLKVDAEGSDFLVLKGAFRLFENRVIRIVQFEYGGAWAPAGSTLAFALRFLRSFGYSTYLLNSKGLMEFDYELYGEYFGHSNFVAVVSDAEKNFNYLPAGRT